MGRAGVTMVLRGLETMRWEVGGRAQMAPDSYAPSMRACNEQDEL